MLTAYRVYLENGTDYVTSMAEGVTLEDACNYDRNRRYNI